MFLKFKSTSVNSDMVSHIEYDWGNLRIDITLTIVKEKTKYSDSTRDTENVYYTSACISVSYSSTAEMQQDIKQNNL